MNETTRVDPLGTLRENFPSMSVTAPWGGGIGISDNHNGGTDDRCVLRIHYSTADGAVLCECRNAEATTN